MKYEFTFPAYTKDDIVEILQHHIGTQIIDPTALQFIARGIASGSGDARQAIEQAKMAIKQAHEKLKNQPLPKSNAEAQPARRKDFLVKMKDVVKTNPAYIKCSKLISEMPAQGKIVVSVVVKMLKESHLSGSVVALTRGELKHKAMEALHRKNPNDFVHPEDVEDLIIMLDDCGILHIDHPSSQYFQTCTFTSNYQAQELEMALQEGLGDNDFLRSFA